MNAFVCASPVQVMRAIQLKMSVDEFNADADIFITNVFRGAEIICQNIIDTNLFNQVYLLDNAIMENLPIISLMYGRNEIAESFRRKIYQKLISFNVAGKQISALYNLNKRNLGFEYHCMEDCPALYVVPVYEKYKWFHPNQLIGLQQPCFHVTKWWTSCPELITIPEIYGNNIEKLPPLDYRNDELVSVINRIFQYKDDPVLSDADILIMDESHYQDGLMMDDADYKMYSKIKDKYKDANIVVKMHPRTQNNRYEGKFTILSNSFIPWEVYVMNRIRTQTRELLQISICCGTMFSDKFLFGHEGLKIFLAPLFYSKMVVTAEENRRIGPEFTHKYELVKATYSNPDAFHIAYSEDEMYKVLDRCLSNKG